MFAITSILKTLDSINDQLKAINLKVEEFGMLCTRLEARQVNQERELTEMRESSQHQRVESEGIREFITQQKTLNMVVLFVLGGLAVPMCLWAWQRLIINQQPPNQYTPSEVQR